jgi:hypothetical protein
MRNTSHTGPRAVGDMMKAPDFDPKMLLSAAQLSHERDMKSLLLTLLNPLLKAPTIGDQGEALMG